MDFSRVQSSYLIGIKGVGMTALAQVLHGRGVRVSGSDTDAHFFTQEVLDRSEIPYREGFAAANVPEDVDVVIRSTAYGAEHVEVAEAMRKGQHIQTYPEALAAIFNAGKGIAVCGSHGKTTTSAMLGWVLAEAGLDPTVLVGSEVLQFGGNARVGASNLIVIEADEYQDKLDYLQPYGVILTNIDYDHPDYFTSPQQYEDTFRRFVRRMPKEGFLAVCGEDARALRVAEEAVCSVIPYGCSGTCSSNSLSHFRAKRRKGVMGPSWRLGADGAVFRGEGRIGGLRLKLPGTHNLLNALGVTAVAAQLDVDPAGALAALARFDGTKRRFEVVAVLTPQPSRAERGIPPHHGGDGAGAEAIVVIDDYAHHPTEIRATIAAAGERFPGRRLLCAFHAHTYSRTIALKDDFAQAFQGCAQVAVMDIFGSAREQGKATITAAEFAAVINAHTPAYPSGGIEATVTAIAAEARRGDVVLCLGAGENDEVARRLAQRLTP